MIVFDGRGPAPRLKSRISPRSRVSPTRSLGASLSSTASALISEARWSDSSACSRTGPIGLEDCVLFAAVHIGTDIWPTTRRPCGEWSFTEISRRYRYVAHWAAVLKTRELVAPSTRSTTFCIASSISDGVFLSRSCSVN